MPKASLVFEKEMPRGHYKVFQSKPEMDLVKVKQTHSSIVLDEHQCQADSVADGIIGTSQRPMAILTADCLPVLLLGEEAHALVHAGWKGLHSEILKTEQLKRLNPTYAFIGPHISVLNYEVQPDFKNNFPDYPLAFEEREGKLFFSLLALARTQLETTYPGIKIEDSGICTFGHLQFHSYRRNNTTERNWNLYIP